MDKRSIRKQIIKMRLEMSEDLYHLQSHFILTKLLNHPQIKDASTIGLYLSYKHEVDTYPIIKELMKYKKVAVPRVEDDGIMNFVYIDSFDLLQKNRYGIDEPINDSIVDKNDLDVIVVPLVGYNDLNYRLGYGGGYYDRYLADYKGYTIGIAFPFQRINGDFQESHDLPINEIITSD